MFYYVSDPPEISVETPVVFSGEGQEAMLVCIVHGEAQPEVNIRNNTIFNILMKGHNIFSLLCVFHLTHSTLEHCVRLFCVEMS